MDLESVIQSEVRKTKTNIVYKCMHVKSRKMVQMNLVPGQEPKCRCRQQMYGHGAGGHEGGGELGD